MENTTQKKVWFWISLYNSTSEIEWLSKKEKYLVKQYEQLQGYIKAYKKDVLNTAQNKVVYTGYTSITGEKVNGKELAKIKLDNIEVYSTNVELERLGKLEHWILPLRKSKQQKQRAKENSKAIGKISTQQQINKKVEFCMSGYKEQTPLDILDNKYKASILKKRVNENITLILWYKKLNAQLQKAYKNKKHWRYTQKLLEKKDYKQFEIVQTIFKTI